MPSEPHPEAQELLERLEGGPPMHEQTPEQVREGMRERSRPDTDPESVGSVEDVYVRKNGHALPVRVYTPDGDGPFPVLVWAHGGGFVFGDIETEDPIARALTNAAECVVVSVDYRLAPEHPFPAPQRDLFAATEWVSESIDAYGGDPDRIAVGGVSSGANMAAATALWTRDHDGPDLGYQVLVVPAVNYSQEFPSHEEFGSDDDDVSDWYDEQYLEDPLDGYHPYAYPLEADDFSGLPPATIVTAGFDTLQDEGKAYAEALEDAGSEVEHRHYEDTIHQFFTQIHEPEWDRARDAVEAVSRDLKARFGH